MPIKVQDSEPKKKTKKLEHKKIALTANSQHSKYKRQRKNSINLKGNKTNLLEGLLKCDFSV